MNTSVDKILEEKDVVETNANFKFEEDKLQK